MTHAHYQGEGIRFSESATYKTLRPDMEFFTPDGLLRVLSVVRFKGRHARTT